jgi:DNA invertase Pin-like site-specific DNA recombinase
MLTTPLRAVGYRRVSSQEQTEGHSLDAQTTHIQNYIQAQGWSLVQFYTDAGISAKKGSHRPAFEQMLKDAQKGGFDVIVVDKIDRFYRHLTGLLTALDQLNSMGVSLASVQEKLDLTTPWGKLMLTVLGMLAEIYIDNLRQETKKGHRQRARAGLWGGEIPYGYCRGLCSDCKHPNGKDYCPNYGKPNLSDGKHMIAHPVESIGVKLMFEWYATGETSMSAIADKLTGYKVTLPDGTEVALRQKGHVGHLHQGPFSKDVVRNILGRFTYTGKIAYIGTDERGKFRSRKPPIEIYQGQHPALVSQELFDKVNELRRLLAFPAHNRTRKIRHYPLTGVLRCGLCGANMRGVSSGIYYSYVCGERVDHSPYCIQNAIRAFKTEDRIAGMIGEIVSRADEGKTFDFIQEQVVKVEQRYSRVQELYLDGQIGRDQYEKELESYENGQKTLQPEKLRATIALLDQLRMELSRWDALSPIEKKRLLRAALEGAWVRENALVALQPTIAFLPILIGIGLSTCGESGIRTHGGDKPHNGFRDRPIRPLWHLSRDCW